MEIDVVEKRLGSAGVLFIALCCIWPVHEAWEKSFHSPVGKALDWIQSGMKVALWEVEPALLENPFTWYLSSEPYHD